MTRAKRTAPQSADDVALAKETITAAFHATVNERVAEVAKARAEVQRLQQQATDAASRLAAWIDDGTITEQTALDAHLYAHRATFDLLKGVNTTAALALIDPAAREAALRQAAVTKRWLVDHDLLPAELAKPDRRPTR